MKLRCLVLSALAVLVVGGCGSGGAKLAPDDVAVVGSQHVTTAMFDAALQLEQRRLTAQGEPLPKRGSAGYSSIKSQIMTTLIQQAELEAGAAQLGIQVTDAQVQRQLASIRRQYFSDSESKYRAQLEQQGLTEAQVRVQIREQLVQQDVFARVTKGVTVTGAAVRAYYHAHSADYRRGASRSVREILVGKGKQALARQIYHRLQGGADFAALAKRYSTDPASRSAGGKSIVTEGAGEPELDKVVFAKASRTGKLLAPIDTARAGWLVVEPLSEIKPATTTSEAAAAGGIRSQLVQAKMNQAMQDWLTGLSTTYCKGSKIKYRSGYEPAPDPCVSRAAP